MEQEDRFAIGTVHDAQQLAVYGTQVAINALSDAAAAIGRYDTETAGRMLSEALTAVRKTETLLTVLERRN